ncbi:MAG: di-heme oxidoredictase family protein [Phycisphaerales bacterium]|jgi:CxxC motif-containing protein (DUF1111 family)
MSRWRATRLAMVAVAGWLLAWSDVQPLADTSRLALLGGPATVHEAGPNAFGLPMPGLAATDRRAFSVGNALFRDNWVVAPASAEGRDGLGPVFNASSCSACHPEDGRGKPAMTRDDLGAGMVVMVSPRDADGQAHPVYGRQLQDQAIPGVEPEVRLELKPRRVTGSFADGTPWELQRLELTIDRPAYGALGEVRTSLRVGPQVIGMGLLEAVADADLEALADPGDRDGDSISGRVHRIASTGRIGRFGWKASQPSLEGQVRAALSEDVGITSDAFPEESLSPAQRIVIDAPSGGQPEIDAFKVERIAHYCRVLAVPAQRGAGEPLVERGRELFSMVGCAACHVPELRTAKASPVQALRGATFHPYTDLLLHDMGEDLADHRRDGDADGREWRTPPLWGIGLVGTVNGHTQFLHDGRARNLQEAVLWHGGEAQRSRDAFVAMPQSDRRALIAFLESL